MILHMSTHDQTADHRCTGLTEMYDRGWVAYRPRLVHPEGPQPLQLMPRRDLESSPVLRPSGADAGFASPKDELLQDAAKVVVGAVLGPLPMRPLASIRCVVESVIDTKIFLKFTRWLAPEVQAISFYYPLAALLSDGVAGPIAFYGTITPSIRTPHESIGAMLTRRLALAHEDMHILLHIHDAMKNLRGCRADFDEFKRGYEAYIREETTCAPCIGPSPRTAETEADLCGFLALLKRGFLRMQPADSREVSEISQELGLAVDSDWLVSETHRVAATLPRPRSVVGLDCGAPPLRFGKLDDSIVPRERFLQLWDISSDIAERARSLPYAWVCRAVESLFDSGFNASVSIKKDDSIGNEPECRVVRESLQSAIRAESKAHWLRYTIRYPANWDLQADPLQRAKVLRWIGLIAHCERRKPPLGPCDEVRKLNIYSAADIEWANRFAVVLNAFAGAPGHYELYSSKQAEWMLSESTFGLPTLLKYPSFGSSVHDFFHKESQDA